MVRFDRVGGDRNAAWKALAEMGNEVWAVVAINPSLRGPVFAKVAKAKSHRFTAAEGEGEEMESEEIGILKAPGINNTYILPQDM